MSENIWSKSVTKLKSRKLLKISHHLAGFHFTRVHYVSLEKDNRHITFITLQFVYRGAVIPNFEVERFNIIQGSIY